MTRLSRAAERAVKQSLKLRPGESFLLVTDKEKLEIAEALAYWAKRQGAETTTYLMTESLRPITKPTKLFREMARKATAIAYLLDSRIDEKPFRGFMVETARKHGRICMMPGITREMVERLVNIDYEELRRFTQKVIRVLRNADHITLKNPEGTHIEFSVQNRRWINSSGDISRRGKHGNLPAGECYTAPVEETFTGRLVISLIDDQQGRGIMEFERGRLVRWQGKGVKAVVQRIGRDLSGMIIGEFGIGTNKAARLSPHMLEAEKAFGTAHFAIGDSYGLGLNSSRHHYDALINRVTIKTRSRVVVQNGKFLV